MANILFANNASALLAASISDVDTSLSVEAGKGSLFPSPTGSQYFKVALVDAGGNLEIIKVTARSSDTFTIERAQEGTTAQSWTLNVTRVELRLTKGQLEEFLQASGDTLTGNLDADNNEIQNSRQTGDTVIVGGQTVGTKIRGAEDDASNEIDVPNDGSRATAGGSNLITQADNLFTLLPIGTILMWYGTLASLPSGWQICNGTNGTPDMRGNFPRGAGGSIALGGTGGSATGGGTTDPGGNHNHGGNTGGHTLTVNELPAHAHGGYYNGGYERGIPQSATSRFGPVIPGVTKNDSGILDTTSNSNDTTSSDPITTEEGGGAAHNHSIGNSGTHTHTLSGVSIIPPYVGVYFIMKVS